MLLFALTVAGQALASKGTTTHRYKVSSSNHSFWAYRVHPAENPNWQQHGTFEGGLGIWYDNWDKWSNHFGLNGIYPSAGDAPPNVQIMVADWAYHYWRDGNGRRPYWGSFSHVGYPQG